MCIFTCILQTSCDAENFPFQVKKLTAQWWTFSRGHSQELVDSAFKFCLGLPHPAWVPTEVRDTCRWPEQGSRLVTREQLWVQQLRCSHWELLLIWPDWLAEMALSLMKTCWKELGIQRTLPKTPKFAAPHPLRGNGLNLDMLQSYPWREEFLNSCGPRTPREKSIWAWCLSWQALVRESVVTPAHTFHVTWQRCAF